MHAVQQSSINPAFAAHAAKQLREATEDLQRVFDNLLEIDKGRDQTANTHDRLRATRILYDRGFGKVSKNTPQAPAPRSSRPPKSEESHNHTNHSSDNCDRMSTQPSSALRLCVLSPLRSIRL